MQVVILVFELFDVSWHILLLDMLFQSLVLLTTFVLQLNIAFFQALNASFELRSHLIDNFLVMLYHLLDGCTIVCPFFVPLFYGDYSRLILLFFLLIFKIVTQLCNFLLVLS